MTSPSRPSIRWNTEGIDTDRLPDLYQQEEFLANLATFVAAFDWMAQYIHAWAKRKGFWERGQDRNDGELIALMHSELSEALEAMRKGNPPDDKLPGYDSLTTELADCVIRIMDAAGGRGLPLGQALAAKMMYNETRPHKHGKSF